MHACLNVDEIVRLIAGGLVTSGGEATAVGLACCCKSFEDPALDALWAELDRLLPLLKTFPGDVWNEGKYTSSFRRLPTTTEWARFRKYARKIRKLENRGNLDSPSLEVFSVIQCYTINEPFLPNLKTLDLWAIEGSFVSFIPLFISPRTTSISLSFKPGLPKAMVTSTVTTLSRLCPNLEVINLRFLPRDPMITTAVSEMLLVTDKNTLQELHVGCPLTEEANQVICRLPNLRDLTVVIERETLLPSASLPGLTELVIVCDNKGGWPRFFDRATLGKLKNVTFFTQSKQIGDFLEEFERVALSSSIQNTLSEFSLYTSSSWNPNYSSLLPFTQLEHLEIESSCKGGCSSRVDDELVINLSRAMPKLEVLCLGDYPCREFTTGVTAKGLVALAHHCPNLSELCVHFQVASLSTPPASSEKAPNTESSGLWPDCALKDLAAGEIPVPEESVLMVALTLLRIFPRIVTIDSVDKGWKKVKDAIYHSKRIVDFSKATPETGS